MKPGYEDELRLAERAAQWLGALKEESCPNEAIFNWLAESPRHVEAFLSTFALAQQLADLTPQSLARVERLARDAGTVDLPSGNVMPLTTGYTRESRGRPARRPRVWARSAGIAAGVLILAISAWFVTLAGRQTYTTAVGEQRVIELSDGSVVHMNTRSRLEVRFTADARSLRLLEGQALFQVEPDVVRPFVVYSGAAAIQALGTQFDVYRHSSDTRVAVLEGSVQISKTDSTIRLPLRAPAPGSDSQKAPVPGLSPAGNRARLAAGEAVDIAANGTITRREDVDAAKTTAWRQRRLVFREDTLSEIAAEFNRYNSSLQIRVVGAIANGEHFSGSFEADAPETLMQALAADDTLMVERRGREILISARQARKSGH